MVIHTLAALALAGPSVMQRDDKSVLSVGVEGHIGASVADLDEDGAWDVVYPHDQTTIGVWLSTAGAGAPASDPSTEPLVAALPYDIDADGRVDLVVVHRDLLVWYLNAGGGTLGATRSQSATQLGVGATALRGAAVIDLDDDGTLDLLLAHTDGFRGLRWDDKLEAFEALAVPGLATAGLTDLDGLLVSDLDHDGHVDVAGRHDTTGVGPVWLWSSGGFTNQLTPDVRTGADHGGLVSCAWSEPWGQLFFSEPASDGNTWWTHTGSSFALVEELDLENGIRGLACADFDHDGDLDLFLADDGTDRLCSAPWTGSSTTGCDGVGLGSVRSISPTTADLDDDGDLDVLVPGDQEPLQVFVTTAPTDDYLQVRVLTPTGTCEEPSWRDDIGAQVEVAEASPPWREVSGGEQRGQLPWPVLHFGGIDGSQPTKIRVVPSDQPEFRIWVTPDDLGDPKRRVVKVDDPDDDGLVDESRTADLDGDTVLDFLDDDIDGDGLLDVDEFTDPCDLPDTDGDGITDPYDPTDDRPTGLTGGTGQTGHTGTAPPTADTVDTAGGTATGDTDTSTNGTTSPTDPGGAATAADGKAAAGCACDSSGGGLWLGLLGLGLARRR